MMRQMLVLFALAACVSERPPGDETCELGQPRGCECDAGDPGTQSCLFAEPAEWSVCTCNATPIADAGDDLSVPLLTQVDLDGTASRDPDSSVLVYSWALVDKPVGSATTLEATTDPRPSFFADRQGLYVARLIVGDGTKWSEPANVTVTVVQTANAAPIADAGLNAIVITGLPHVLDGSGSSDPDGDPLAYAWAITVRPVGSNTVLANANTLAPTFTPDVDGTYAIRLVVSDGILTSTADTITIDTGPQPNTAPIAEAGHTATAATGQSTLLDGTASFDPDGDPLTYAWVITSRPVGSTAVLANPTTASPTLTPDLDGTYEVMLVVHDGALASAPDVVSVTATTSTLPNTAPIADAGPDIGGAVSQPIVLNGSDSSDADGDLLSYSWVITARPAGSTATLATSTVVAPTFTPDVSGSYQVTLVVHDGALTSTPDTVTVTAVVSTTALPFEPVDAEYSSALDRIIMVASQPNTLHIYEPGVGTSVAVALPTAPTSVSVSPNGLQAAVGHDGWVSIVDLHAGVVTVTRPVSTKALDVVLAGNGFVYVFPALDQWETIRCVNIATGAETLSTGGPIYAGTKAKLHPSGTAIYGADHLSPSDLEKYSLGAGTASLIYDSPYHGDFPMCGDLWLSEDGQRIITRCGNVFRASNVMAQDMIYGGSLAGVGIIQHAVHAPVPGKIVTISQDNLVRIYDYEFLNFDQQLALPAFIVLGQTFPSHGRFVFGNAAGTHYHVIMRADVSSGAVNDHAVVTFAF